VGESIITPTNALSVDFPRNHKQLATARLASVTHIEPILGRKDEVGKQKNSGKTRNSSSTNTSSGPFAKPPVWTTSANGFTKGTAALSTCTSETQTSQYSVNANDSTTTNAQSKISESTFSTEQPKLNTASPLTGSAGCSSANQKTNAKTSKCSNTTHSEAPSLRLSFSIDAVQPQLETERVLWNSSVGKAANAPYQQYGKLHREPINESIQIFKTNSHPVTSLHTQTPKHDKPINTFNANPSSTHSDSTLDEFK